MHPNTYAVIHFEDGRSFEVAKDGKVLATAPENDPTWTTYRVTNLESLAPGATVTVEAGRGHLSAMAPRVARVATAFNTYARRPGRARAAS
jgi:hypothetical protein